MDQTFFYVVMAISLIMMLVIWINLIRNNEKQEKIISKYSKEIASIKRSANS
ncbi:MAG: hypothetical protein ABGW91_10990 [Christiangramia sp.]|uniref:Uncharacterized protein n=1 Tax=Christiangramia flava JLT2011 TaxID=1229726 RepID=A0A1L7I062_9FLAO|nr:hypothetical protein [Christiangramia flava]APU66981.1 hypothetical protein GRFL_0257 [Christiangramia flava JLT2011]OSS38653.1 hypothetical protein C723_2371 [Christiangramia flava JLT2011]